MAKYHIEPSTAAYYLLPELTRLWNTKEKDLTPRDKALLAAFNKHAKEITSTLDDDDPTLNMIYTHDA
jgi:hypothetical protein